MSSLTDSLFSGSQHYGMARRAWITLLLVSILAMFPGQFSIPVMDRDEARYSQASSQMLETGDFIDIRFQEDVRYVKPVGIYWMQVVTALPFGGEDAPIGAYRLPSFLASIGAVLLTAWFGTRIFGPQVGFAAGVILALSFMMQIEARTAKTDSALLLAGLWAQISLFFLMVRNDEARPKFWGWPAAFWAATGLAILIKGPIITMVSALTVVVYAGLQRDWRLVLRLRPLPGLALALAIFLPWVIAISIQTGGAFLEESVGHALFGKVAEADDSHGGPFLFHTMLSPVTWWPGGVLLGLGGLYAWKHRQDQTVQFLLAWAIPTWIVFELVQTKLPHYILPVFPAMALLMVMGMKETAGLLKSWKSKSLHWLFAVLSILVSVVLGALPWIAESEFGEPVSIVGYATAVFGILCVSAIVLWALKPDFERLAVVTVTTIGLYVSAFGVLIPSVDGLWPSERVSRIADHLQGCEDIQYATAGYREPSNVFYLGTDMLLGNDGAETGQFLLDNATCGVAIVEEREMESFMQTINEAGERLRPLAQVEGVNAVKGRDIVLTVFVTELSPIRLADN